MNRNKEIVTTNIDTQKVQAWDKKHYLHPWAELSNSKADFGVLKKAKGIYLYDKDGKQYIDGPGGMWCISVGYGRKEIAEAVSNQLNQLPYTSPWSSTTEPSAILAKKISDKTPGDLNSVFFSTCGSTAVDTAIRFVHFYFNVRKQPKKKIIISREKGYHGSTYLSASASGKERDKRYLDTDKTLVKFLPDVNPNIRPEGTSVEEWCDEKVNDLKTCIELVGAKNIGAFIAEPILASGGVIIPPSGYHKKTLEICKENEILYISDEVVTGFGRLGHWFSSKDVFDIEPDIITCAKGLTSGYIPMGATIISDQLVNEIIGSGQKDVLFSNGYTYSGHPAAAAAANKTIDIIEREGILEHVQEVSPHFQTRLIDLEKKFKIIGNARGIGLLGCLEGDIGRNYSETKKLSIDHEFGKKIDAAAERRGLLVRPLINMCVFSPPLIITKKEIDIMFNILEDSLYEVQNEMLK